MRKGMIIVIVIPLCSIFIIVGASLCLKGIRSCLKAHNSMKWNPVVCKVLSSKIDEKRDSDGCSMFETIVSYHYHHNGNQYIGNKIYFGYESSSEKEDYEKIAKLLPEGKETTAYINPTNPNEAVLIPGIQRFTLVDVWSGFGIAFMGFWFLILWYLSKGGQADIFYKAIGSGY